MLSRLQGWVEGMGKEVKSPVLLNYARAACVNYCYGRQEEVGDQYPSVLTNPLMMCRDYMHYPLFKFHC